MASSERRGTSSHRSSRAADMSSGNWIVTRMTSIVPPNFGSGAEGQPTQEGARRRAEGVTPLLPQARKVVGATGFEPATPCAQDRRRRARDTYDASFSILSPG